jgi:DNA-binding NarL/FixJ family response regulator
VLLADRHHGLRDSVRGLLETTFDAIFMVADEASLLEGIGRLRPEIVVIDMSLSSGSAQDLIANVAERAPGSKVIMLSVHDEPTVAEAALNAGADAVVLKRGLATDLLSAIDSVRAGNHYLSPEIAK